MVVSLGAGADRESPAQSWESGNRHRAFPAAQLLGWPGREELMCLRSQWLRQRPQCEAVECQGLVVGEHALSYNWGMKIHELIWPEDRIDHIASHGIEPEEVEEVCFARSLVQRAKSKGKNPVYHVLGQTATGRYLFSVVIQLADGRGYPVTARPMTGKEEQRFNRWKKR